MARVAGPAAVRADEPTGHLDSRTAASLLERFAEVTAPGQTLVVVTHDPSIGELADRVVTVADGRIAGIRSRGESPGAGSDRGQLTGATVAVGDRT
jgi:putative ABC transport system ATP-binding protein